MRRILLAAALVVAGSCGGSPMAPSTGAPSSPALLASGSYLLTVSMSTSGTSGLSSCVSLTIGGAPPAFAAVFVPTPVHVERVGNSVTIAPDDPSATFRMQLQIAGAALSGTASGQYGSSATPITVTGRSSEASAAVTGTIGASFASGALEGTVGVAGWSCTNNGHSWMLGAR
jgi:hypothetical protein